MRYLKNTWYVVAFSAEIRADRLFARTILNEPLVLFRKQDGSPAALSDRCPHRFAPLSFGRQKGDAIECAYHGLTFDCSGNCVVNPHGPIPQHAVVRRMPVEERHGFVWIWMGEPDCADGTSIPDFSFVDNAPPATRIECYLSISANYQLVTDNLMDLSHVDYLHPTSLGNADGGISRSKPTIKEPKMGTLMVSWAVKNVKAPAAFNKYLTKPDADVDQWLEMTWHAPSNMELRSSMTLAGTGRERAIESKNVHLLTPETTTSTHYFIFATRNFEIENSEVTSRRKDILMEAFSDEDKPVIEAQQHNMTTADLMDLRPVLLAPDKGPMRVRRILDRMIEEEASIS